MINHYEDDLSRLLRIIIPMIVTQIVICFLPTIRGYSAIDTLFYLTEEIADGGRKTAGYFFDFILMLCNGVSAVTLLLMALRERSNCKRAVNMLIGATLQLAAVELFHRLCFESLWDKNPKMNFLGFLTMLILPTIVVIVLKVIEADMVDAGGDSSDLPPINDERQKESIIDKNSDAKVESIRCTNCGEEVSSDKYFCPHCSSYIGK